MLEALQIARLRATLARIATPEKRLHRISSGHHTVVNLRFDAVLVGSARLSREKSGASARIFGGFLRRDDSDPAALSMSLAMSAISFVMDGVAHAANDGFVS